jgi:hypothetical protein
MLKPKKLAPSMCENIPVKNIKTIKKHNYHFQKLKFQQQNSRIRGSIQDLYITNQQHGQ